MIEKFRFLETVIQQVQLEEFATFVGELQCVHVMIEQLKLD